MTSQTLAPSALLEQSEALLREVHVRDFAGASGGDGGSLERMLVHLVNIHRAVSVSAAGHDNAAKRLGDFALTMDRLAQRKPESAANLARVASILRAASTGLANALDATVETPPDAHRAPGARRQEPGAWLIGQSTRGPQRSPDR